MICLFCLPPFVAILSLCFASLLLWSDGPLVSHTVGDRAPIGLCGRDEIFISFPYHQTVTPAVRFDGQKYGFRGARKQPQEILEWEEWKRGREMGERIVKVGAIHHHASTSVPRNSKIFHSRRWKNACTTWEIKRFHAALSSVDQVASACGAASCLSLFLSLRVCVCLGCLGDDGGDGWPPLGPQKGGRILILNIRFSLRSLMFCLSFCPLASTVRVRPSVCWVFDCVVSTGRKRKVCEVHGATATSSANDEEEEDACREVVVCAFD